MSRIITKSLVLVALLGSVCLSSGVSLAYEDVKLSPNQKAVFGYFSAIGSIPDYEFWIKSRDTYEYLPDHKRQDYLIDETLKLGQAFSTYDPDMDLIELSADIVVKYSSATEEQKPRIVFEFFESNQEGEDYIPTFDYKYGEDVISLVVNQLAFFANMELEEEQSQAIEGKIPVRDEYFQAKIEIAVKPSKNSSQEPIVEGDNRKWVMIGDIAHIKCYLADSDKVMWDYTAPWYEEAKKKKAVPKEEEYPHPYDLFKD